MADDDLHMGGDDDLNAGFDDDLGFGEDGFDEFEKKEKTLGDLWRDNPLVKVGVIFGVIFLVILIIFMMGGEEEEVAPSLVRAGSVTAAPGTEETSQVYTDAVEEENEARVEEAIRDGGSALPTPIEPPIGRLTIEESENDEEDPLQRWRRLQEERMERELNQARVIDTKPQTQVDTTALVEAMSQAMSEQMQAILEARNTPVNVASVSITGVDYLQKLEQQRLAELNPPGDNTSVNGENQANVILPAAYLAYAQMITEANSDVPGPVLAQIMTGPLSGSRILGSFSVQEDLMVVTFDTAVVDGKSIPINAIALDPETTLPAMATDVDHRYFKRIVLPAAAAFVEGAAQAIADSGRTTITVSGETVTEEEADTSNEQEISAGIAEAGQEVREILDEMADGAQILVRIERGTGMSLLFLDAVVDQTVQPIPSNNTPGFGNITAIAPIVDPLPPGL